MVVTNTPTWVLMKVSFGGVTGGEEEREQTTSHHWRTGRWLLLHWSRFWLSLTSLAIRFRASSSAVERSFLVDLLRPVPPCVPIFPQKTRRGSSKRTRNQVPNCPSLPGRGEGRVASCRQLLTAAFFHLRLRASGVEKSS